MAIASEVTNVVFPGNNSTFVEYPAPFPVLDGSHLKVGVRLVGGPFAQLPAWDFTVVPKAGGTFAITTASPIPSSASVVIWREVPNTQLIELPLAGRLPSSSIETGLDKLTMQVQELRADLDRAILLDRSAPPQPAIPPTPNALFGFDANGNFQEVTAARVRELAQLEGDGANLQATWEDEAAQFSTAPLFSGQLGVRRSDKTLWVSLSTTGGDWVEATLPPVDSGIPSRIVTDEEELLVAIASPGIYEVRGDIVLSAALNITVAGVKLVAGTVDAGVQFPHTAGVQGEYVVKIAAKNVELIGLSITSNHPLTSDNNKAFPDFGVILSADAGVDISGGRVHRCHIHHVGTAIERQGAASFPTRRFDITECEIDSIWFYGMNIVWNVGGFNVSYNILRGVMVGDVHTNQGNGIWLGNNGQLAQIHKNTVSHFARHGIEYWNAQTEAGTLNGNRGGKITGNNVFSMGPGSFGISAFGTGGLHVVQNSVSECAIGIEIYNDPVNKARNLIALNVIENIYGQGISLNNTKNTTVVDNIIGFCQPFNPAVGNAVGIQIIYGAENLVVRGNQFKNAGHRSILLNGRMALISAVEAEAADATFTVTAILPLESGDGSDPLFNVGRRVYIRDVVGVVNGAESVNDRYYKITWRSADRLQFRCGFDSRGHTAYTSGGRMQEAYTNVLIEGNTFHYDQEILPTQWSAALYIHDFQKVIVRRNVYWKKIGVPITNFIFVNSGELYIDDSGTIVPSFGEFTGSNMIITSKTGPEF